MLSRVTCDGWIPRASTAKACEASHAFAVLSRGMDSTEWTRESMPPNCRCIFVRLLIWLSVFGALVPAIVSAQAPPLQFNVVHPLPPVSPPWVEGFQVRWPVRVLGEPGKQLDAKSIVVSLPTSGWLKPDASDLAVQTASGKLLGLAVLSHDPLSESIIQFPRNGNDAWYWVYGVNPKGSPAPKVDPKTDPNLKEGVSVEVREWAGDDLSSWAKVRPGLDKSPTVLANGIVGEVVQSANPARPTQPQKLAASYRGFLNIKKEGTYRFVVNAEDAAFLFIDGFKVYEQPGGTKLTGTIKVKDLEKLAGKVDLKPGPHAFEVHHVTGKDVDLTGRCALVWLTPEQPKAGLVGAPAFAHPLYARAAALEKIAGETCGPFAWGLDDSLDIPGIKLFLVRFEAQGPVADPGKLVWDFGDGTTATGRSVTHVYFREGDYLVSLQSPSGLPPVRRRINVWPEPGENSPLTLDQAVRTLEGMDWRKLELARIREIFAFLLVCERPHRWKLLDEVAQYLLAQKGFDLELRSQFYVARLEALTGLGKGSDALKLAAEIKSEFTKTPALQVRVDLAAAAIHQYHYKDATAASKIYKAIIDEHGRTEHPNLRIAGIRWGDLFAEAGDVAKASETYRIAATLGGDKFAGAATSDASTRGALLRIAEQKLKAGDHLAARQLLERIDLDYPGRRLDGLYCFLRAEADRFAGNYENALRHYEMIFKLPQWAGYRDRAVYGLADTYRRLGELDKSQKWLGDLKTNYPKLYEEKKADELVKQITLRLERIKIAKTSTKPDDALFAGWQTGFEPEEPVWLGSPMDFAVVRGPGLFGPHAGLLSGPNTDLVNVDYQRPVKNLSPGVTYLVEVWYRDLIKPPPPLAYQVPGVQFHFIGGKPAVTLVNVGTTIYRNSHHQWHKLSVKFVAPNEPDLVLKMLFTNITGHYLVDGLSLRPISDRQLNALTRFQEGAKGP